MVPADTNHLLAAATINIALTNVPRFLYPFGYHLVSVLLDQRLRVAMKLKEPSRYMVLALKIVLTIRVFILRHMCLPRTENSKELWFSPDVDPVTGRFHAVHYIDRPWYIEPTFATRWNFVSCLLWLVGGVLSSRERPENRPEGYRIQDLGPNNMEGKGAEEMSVSKILLAQQVQRCPFNHSLRK